FAEQPFNQSTMISRILPRQLSTARAAVSSKSQPAAAPVSKRAPADVNEIAAVRAGAAPASKGKVLMLLPENGSDPSETAIPYAVLKAAGHDVVFATASGKPSQVDTLSF